MVILPFAVIWGGYLISIWGWSLVRGYDITLWELARPVNPYQWPRPPKQPGLIPAQQVWPTRHQVKAAVKSASKGPAGGQFT